MTTTFNNLQEKIEKLQAEQKAQEILLTSLENHNFPNPNLSVWQNSKLSKFGLIYKIKNFEEVRPLILAFESFILPLNLTKGTFTTFRTNEHPEEKGLQVNKSVFPVTCNVSTYGVKFEFYIMIDGMLISIDIEFDYGTNFHKVASVYYRMQGRNQESKYVEMESVRLHTALIDYKFIKMGKWKQ